MPGLRQLPPCPEDGTTFEENAREKALYYSGSAPGPLFAEDSGLCVEALDGAPGVCSARFAGAGAGDAANNHKLLEELRVAQARGAGPDLGRSAHYVCSIALADHGRLLVTTLGRVDGVIRESPRGSGGFGYDPLFFHPPLGKTFAELTAEEKFRVSHRGIAFRKLLEWLRRAPNYLAGRVT